MPRYNVEYNGKWACFSTIVDSFITGFSGKETYEDWRKREYGVADYAPAEQRNIMSMSEAVFSASLNRNRNDWIDCLLEAGLPKQEVDKLVYDCETECYCPTKYGDIYKCPNCKGIVMEGQKICSDESCECDLVWRD